MLIWTTSPFAKVVEYATAVSSTPALVKAFSFQLLRAVPGVVTYLPWAAFWLSTNAWMIWVLGILSATLVKSRVSPPTT